MAAETVAFAYRFSFSFARRMRFVNASAASSEDDSAVTLSSMVIASCIHA